LHFIDLSSNFKVGEPTWIKFAKIFWKCVCPLKIVFDCFNQTLIQWKHLNNEFVNLKYRLFLSETNIVKYCKKFNTQFKSLLLCILLVFSQHGMKQQRKHKESSQSITSQCEELQW